jgi:hypothetical protein
MREIAALKLDAFRCPLSLDLAVVSSRQSCPKNRNVSAGPGRRSVGRRSHHPVRRTFCAYSPGAARFIISKTYSRAQSSSGDSDTEIAQPPRGLEMLF